MEEQKKYDVIKKLADEGGNKNRAALNLGISRRQVDRPLKAYRDFGKQAFVHGNRGRKPLKTLPDELKRDIVDLYTMKYCKDEGSVSVGGEMRLRGAAFWRAVPLLIFYHLCF